MFRPLSEDEKREALRDGALGAIEEAKRREPELARLAQTAQTVWQAYLTTPTWVVEEADLPAWMQVPPVEALWSVQTKVTRS